MIKIIGHRGGRGLWPENSMRGFHEAVRLGIDFIEFDVHLSADGDVVVIHDPTLDRTTHGRGAVRRHSTTELAATRLRGAGGECVPTLGLVLDELQSSPIGFCIEIKTDALAARYPDIEARVIDLVNEHGLTDRTRFISFVPEVLETIRMVSPTAEIATPLHRATTQMLGGVARALDRFEHLESCNFHVERTMLPYCWDLCRERVGTERLTVGAVHEFDDLEFWMDQPVAYVATDFPDRAVLARTRATAR